MRTLQDALDRAKSLRNFKVTSPERFEKCSDFEDLVMLADEVERLRNQEPWSREERDERERLRL